MAWVSSLNQEFNLSSIINLLFSSSLDRPEEIPVRYPPPFPHLYLENCLPSQKDICQITQVLPLLFRTCTQMLHLQTQNISVYRLLESTVMYVIIRGCWGLNWRDLLIPLFPLTIDTGVLLFPWTVSQLQPAVPTSVSPGGLQPPARSAAASAVPAAW